MELEKLATSAVISELSKTDRLSSFINNGDKEPCWDGNIYIHENRQRTKKNIKRVSTQVKGKAVNIKKVRRTITYPISYDDLYAYLMDGGTMFFVVYLDENNGTPLQIYYSDLLPIKIKEIIKTKKKKYAVKCRKFPITSIQKTEIFLNFYRDAQSQVSFADKTLPTVEELSKAGVLESLTFSYTSLEKEKSFASFPKMVDGKPITVYANIKGGTIPIPVEYFETISQVVMYRKQPTPVSINGAIYYDEFSVITTSLNIELKIGSSVKVVFPNINTAEVPFPIKIKISINGTLNERIKSIEFISAMIRHGSFCIGEWNIPSKFTKSELKKINAENFVEILEGYKTANELLNAMNVKKDLNISECSDTDIDNLNLLIETIAKHKLVKVNPYEPSQVGNIKIGNLSLAIVYIKNENGDYNIYDYFGRHFHVYYRDEAGERQVSQFATMSANDFLNLDNLNLENIIKDYEMLEQNEWLFEQSNITMLEMLKAYDIAQSSELLEAAKKMLKWQMTRPEFINKEINVLNKLQIALRERSLTFQEKSEIHSIISKTNDNYVKIGGLLLLNEQKEATNLFKSLDTSQLERFKTFPIYNFYTEKGE